MAKSTTRSHGPKKSKTKYVNLAGLNKLLKTAEIKSVKSDENHANYLKSHDDDYKSYILSSNSRLSDSSNFTPKIELKKIGFRAKKRMSKSR